MKMIFELKFEMVGAIFRWTSWLGQADYIAALQSHHAANWAEQIHMEPIQYNNISNIGGGCYLRETCNICHTTEWQRQWCAKHAGMFEYSLYLDQVEKKLLVGGPTGPIPNMPQALGHTPPSWIPPPYGSFKKIMFVLWSLSIFLIKVMLAAVKCKQNVDPALADALDGAVAEMSKMQLALNPAFAAFAPVNHLRYMKWSQFEG